jgi:hypothetical protein
MRTTRTTITLLALLLPLCAIARNAKSEEMCGLRTYEDSLTLIFQNAASTDGEVLVTLQVLPSLEREYALIIKRTSSGIGIFRATLRKQLWTQLGPPLHISRTRQQCLDIAKAAESDTVPIPVSAEQANSLWEMFRRTKLEIHSTGAFGRKHMLPQDSTQYVVQSADGRSVRLTEVVRTELSENPALLDWVHSVLKVAGQWQEPPVLD